MRGGDAVEQAILPVDVICMCDANGDIRPLRFRITDEEQQVLRIDIDKVISTRSVQYVGIEATIFLCQATVGQQQWVFELKYTIRSHRWCLLRKVC